MFKNHYCLKMHSEMYGCKDENISGFNHYNPREVCESNKQHLILQIGYEFFIITYHSCIEGYDHLDFKFSMLTQICEKRKHLPPNRSIHFCKEFKKSIEEGFNFKQSFTEISFNYSNMCGKEYCFVTKHRFTDVLLKEITETYEDNYYLTRDYIDENFSDNNCIMLKDNLYDLYNLNRLDKFRKSQINVVSTVDALIKQINKQL